MITSDYESLDWFLRLVVNFFHPLGGVLSGLPTTCTFFSHVGFLDILVSPSKQYCCLSRQVCPPAVFANYKITVVLRLLRKVGNLLLQL